MSVVVSWLAFPLGSVASHPRRVMSRPTVQVMITERGRCPAPLHAPIARRSPGLPTAVLILSVSAPCTAGCLTRGGAGFAFIRGTGERAGISTGPVGVWVYGHRLALRIAAVMAAALIFTSGLTQRAWPCLLIAILLARSCSVSSSSSAGRRGVSPRARIPVDHYARDERDAGKLCL
jgi:hypothetical protein